MALKTLGRHSKTRKAMKARLVRCRMTLDILREFAAVLNFLNESKKPNNPPTKKENQIWLQKNNLKNCLSKQRLRHETRLNMLQK